MNDSYIFENEDEAGNKEINLIEEKDEIDNEDKDFDNFEKFL